MIKIVALFAVVAACNAGYIQQQYVYPQQPALTIAHQPTYLTHGAHFGYPLQFAVAAPAPTSPPAPAPAPTTPAPPPPPTTTTAAPEPEPFDPNPQYTYSYQVDDAETDDHKSATETRNGDAVSGKYTVVEPDGTLRTVTYTADKDGFVADVQRDAPKSAAPAPTPAPAPAPAPAPVVPVKPTLQYFTVPAPAYRPIKTISTFVQPQLIAQPHHIVAHQPHVFASHGHYSPYVLH